MIKSRQHFDLDKKYVIEKLIIKTPFRFEAIFQNGACFLYFKNAESILSLPTKKIELGLQKVSYWIVVITLSISFKKHQ